MIERLISEYFDLLIEYKRLRYTSNRYEYISSQVKTKLQIILARLSDLELLFRQIFNNNICGAYYV